METGRVEAQRRICGGGQACVLDHCHRTGLERGLLCHGCNVREGVRPEPTFQQYRARPPAIIVGYTTPYHAIVEHRYAEAEEWVLAALGPVPGAIVLRQHSISPMRQISRRRGRRGRITR
ncbi:endonuclease domain-containing protein [Saccharopolyspora pogona]|uniref:endonuclease domain-containing protein n=1 Tax=Saccharopolyspora pogona TaxID=333966 RepID=UPI001686E0E1